MNAYKRGSKGGFMHASRAADSILLSTSDICMHGYIRDVRSSHIMHAGSAVKAASTCTCMNIRDK
jgi:hypothetical protein